MRFHLHNINDYLDQMSQSERQQVIEFVSSLDEDECMVVVGEKKVVGLVMVPVFEGEDIRQGLKQTAKDRETKFKKGKKKDAKVIIDFEQDIVTTSTGEKRKTKSCKQPWLLFKEILRNDNKLYWYQSLVIFPTWREKGNSLSPERMRRRWIKVLADLRKELKNTGIAVEYYNLQKTICTIPGIDSKNVKCTYYDHIARIQKVKNLIKVGNHRQAHKIIEEILEQDPDNIKARLFFVEVAGKVNIKSISDELLTTLVLLRKRLKALSETIDILQKCVDSEVADEKFGDVKMFLSECEMQSDKLSKAISILERYKDTGEIVLDKAGEHIRIIELINLYAEAFKSGQQELAERHFEQLTTENKRFFESIYKDCEAKLKRMFKNLDEEKIQEALTDNLCDLLSKPRDPTKFKSENYLERYLRKTLRKETMRDILIKDYGVPKGKINPIFRYLKAKRDFLQDKHREPEDSEICAIMRISMQELMEIKKCLDLCFPLSLSGMDEFIDSDSVKKF